MGVPLRSNIFRPGSREQREYARFPIQATVLFSPYDVTFRETFQSLFPHLHRMTGDEVVFFAFLDPPSVGDHKRWLTTDNAVLVREVARLFRVPWQWLPCIVAATDLWTLETVVVPTSQNTIERQFRALTALAKDHGRPTLDEIYDVLCTAGAEEGTFQAANEEGRYRLSRLYEILETAEFGDHGRLRRLFEQELKAVERILDRLHRSQVRDHGREDPERGDDAHTDNILVDVSGRLVAPAVAATERPKPLGYELDSAIMEDLDDESRVMIGTGALIAEFFVAELERVRSFSRLDYAPALAPLWKAFERELNLSLVQVAREARGVAMPDFFVLYEPLLGQIKIPVNMGSPVNINVRDHKSVGRRAQKLLMLGAALSVIEAMTASDADYRELVHRYLGTDLPAGFLAATDRIREIRNKGSHSSLDESSYRDFLGIELNHSILPSLVNVKRSLRGARAAP